MDELCRMGNTIKLMTELLETTERNRGSQRRSSRGRWADNRTHHPEKEPIYEDALSI